MKHKYIFKKFYKSVKKIFLVKFDYLIGRRKKILPAFYSTLSI